MNQQIYWHAPIWEVALIVFTGFLIVCWMIYRIFSPKQLYRALRTVHPLLDTQPLFFYTKIQGLYFLNSSSRDLLDLLSEEQHRQTDFLVDIMSESITENRPIQEMGWLRKDQVLIAIPFVGEDEIGALVTVIRIDEGTELNVEVLWEFRGL
ncbi:MAG: hypothetical protein KDD92_12750, partial [Caldilineaceae bacterium]|nr:hypothetical protein [Caldilineaceae bacterium]